MKKTELKQFTVFNATEQLLLIDAISQEDHGLKTLLRSIKKYTSRRRFAEELHNQVKDTLQYRRRKFGSEIYIKSPRLSWKEKAANEVDLLVFYAYVLRKKKIPFCYSLVRFNNRKYFDHAFFLLPINGVSLGQGYISFDPMSDTPFNEHPSIDERQIITPKDVIIKL